MSTLLHDITITQEIPISSMFSADCCTFFSVFLYHYCSFPTNCIQILFMVFWKAYAGSPRSKVTTCFFAPKAYNHRTLVHNLLAEEKTKMFFFARCHRLALCREDNCSVLFTPLAWTTCRFILADKLLNISFVEHIIFTRFLLWPLHLFHSFFKSIWDDSKNDHFSSTFLFFWWSRRVNSKDFRNLGKFLTAFLQIGIWASNKFQHSSKLGIREHPHEIQLPLIFLFSPLLKENVCYPKISSQVFSHGSVEKLVLMLLLENLSLYWTTIQIFQVLSIRKLPPHTATFFMKLRLRKVKKETRLPKCAIDLQKRTKLSKNIELNWRFSLSIGLKNKRQILKSPHTWKLRNHPA